jgi:hypothetical protein
MASYPKPPMKMVKVSPSLHDQIVAMSESMGITPGELVEEAVLYYLGQRRGEINRRVQERLDWLFQQVDERNKIDMLPMQEASREG